MVRSSLAWAEAADEFWKVLAKLGVEVFLVLGGWVAPLCNGVHLPPLGWIAVELVHGDLPGKTGVLNIREGDQIYFLLKEKLCLNHS